MTGNSMLAATSLACSLQVGDGEARHALPLFDIMKSAPASEYLRATADHCALGLALLVDQSRLVPFGAQPLP